MCPNTHIMCSIMVHTSCALLRNMMQTLLSHRQKLPSFVRVIQHESLLNPSQRLLLRPALSPLHPTSFLHRQAHHYRAPAQAQFQGPFSSSFETNLPIASTSTSILTKDLQLSPSPPPPLHPIPMLSPSSPTPPQLSSHQPTPFLAPAHLPPTPPTPSPPREC